MLNSKAQIQTSINQEELKKDIGKVIEVINKSKKKYICPRPKTITSYLKGASKSPFYNSFYRNYPALCGKYPNLSISDVKTALDLMEEKDMLSRSGLGYRLLDDEINHKLDRIFLYRSTSKEYLKSDLLRLSDWEKGHNSTSNIKEVKILDGWLFPADSKEEISIVKKFTKHSYYKILRGQSMAISYRTLKAKKTKNYYPDLVMLTHDNRIAIVEVKPIDFMSNYYTIAKYNGLKKYSKKHQYICTMCDRNFTTFEDLMNRRVSKKIKQKFMRVLKKDKSFYQDHFNKWVKGMTTKEKSKVKRNIHIIIIQERLMNYGNYDQFEIRNLKKIKNIG